LAVGYTVKRWRGRSNAKAPSQRETRETGPLWESRFSSYNRLFSRARAGVNKNESSV
jgi:hypothetical protein